MKKMITFLSVFSLLSSHAQACLWGNFGDRYWPSNRIEVCFLPPHENDLQNREWFDQAREMVISDYALFNQATDFEFYGFNFCDDLNSQTRTEKIRIDLVSQDTLGEAGSIGPGSAKNAVNLWLPYVTPVPPRVGEVILITPAHMRLLVFHETMHLLGLMHDMDRENTKVMNTIRENSDILIVGGYDVDSLTIIPPHIPTRIANDPTYPQFSAGDLMCLQEIANRTIHLRPSD